MTIRRSLPYVLALAIALAMPALAVPDGGGDGDHGRDGTPSQVGNPSGSGHGDHGDDNQAGSPPPAADSGNTGEQDDHGNDGAADNQGPNNNPDNQGNNGAATVERFRSNLAATPAGTAIGASGNVDVRAQDQLQRLKVEIEANVPDGTMFNVLANGVMVGTLSIRFDEAELEIDTQDGSQMPGGLLPGVITSVMVTDSTGATVLQAQFGAVAPGAGQPPPPPAVDHETVALIATVQGMTAGASGHVSRRVQGARQRLVVEVEAKVADGTAFSVLADGVMIGTLTFRLQEAEFEIESENAVLPIGLSSIAGIQMIQVVDGSGVPLLAAAL